MKITFEKSEWAELKALAKEQDEVMKSDNALIVIDEEHMTVEMNPTYMRKALGITRRHFRVLVPLVKSAVAGVKALFSELIDTADDVRSQLAKEKKSLL